MTKNVRTEPHGYTEIPEPYSREDEIALIGALLGGDAAWARQVKLDADDFYDERLGLYWKAIQSLADRNSGIDILTMQATLNGRWEEAGGNELYFQLLTSAGAYMNMPTYAETIRNLAHRRRLLRAGQKIAALAGTPPGVLEGEALSPREMTDRAYSLLDGIAVVSDRPVITMASAISAVWDARLAARARRGSTEVRVPDMPTGFTEIDMMTDFAFAPGVLMVIIALPKMGKTTLGLQISLEAAKHGYPVVYATYEMSVERLAMRAWAILSGIPETVIREGLNLSDEAEQKLVDAMDALAKLPIQFVNTPIDLLMNEVNMAEERYGAKGLLIVDNVNSAARVKADDNQSAQISDSLGKLDEIKLRSGFAVLGLAHQRDDYDKQASTERLKALLRPNLFNSFGSRAPMRYGELVMGLWRPEVISQQIAGFDDSLGEDGTPNGAARMTMLATRYGPSDGTCKLLFNSKVPRFEKYTGRSINLDTDDDATILGMNTH